MTEVGEKWRYEQAIKTDLEDYEQAHALSPTAAEFWLRAFCDDVEKRAAELRKECSNPREAAFTLLKRELLGEK